jgi:putative acetyltransferase
MSAHPKPGLRPYLPADAELCAAIFEASILDLTGDDYTQAQQEAWVASIDDAVAFSKRLAGQLTLIASLGESAVGFASLKGADHLDLLYVHPAATGNGVATALCEALEKLAAARGAQRLSADVSDTAHAFFAKRGYVDWRRNTLPHGDEWLANTTMRKELAAAAGKDDPS